MLIKNNGKLFWLTHHSLHGRIRGTKNVSPTNCNAEEEVQKSWDDLDFIYAEYQVTEYCQWTGPVGRYLQGRSIYDLTHETLVSKSGRSVTNGGG